MAWFFRDMNQPGKVEHYLIQIAFYVAKSIAKNPNSLTMEQFRLRIEAKAEREVPIEVRTAMAKVAWAGRLGVKLE